MANKVFIDGQEGTTGLEIFGYLDHRDDIELIPVDTRFRKDPSYKRERYNESDVVVLCLPDAAARDAVALEADSKVLDASTAHRTSEGWAYGLPELTRQSRAAITQAKYVANPGCYPTGFLLAARPLIDAGIVDDQAALQIHAVSGYSGGGKQLIAKYSSNAEQRMDTQIYGLNLRHKHLPEMTHFSGLANDPVFLPSVGPFYRGMNVKFALPHTDAEAIWQAWEARYAEEPFVQVLPVGGGSAVVDGFLSAERCNGTNRVDLLVATNGVDSIVCAMLDNLGKGAAAAAIQNLNLMTGIEETKGLKAYA
ncbi:MAG: N-acetyl-gamma-glutamyl-phosphate reductase [Gammaproteobacteria bacterium]|nr:N-acetyl-gamma-glutamyl-phosphate reductase [Gammaproteobacteria bacterium]